MKQKKLIFNFFVNRNWKKLTDSRKKAKILADNRTSHHPMETLLSSWKVKKYSCSIVLTRPFFHRTATPFPKPRQQQIQERPGVKTMVNRAYRLSSTEEGFAKECNKLRTMFSKLRYPKTLVDSTINKFSQEPDKEIHTVPSVDPSVYIVLTFKDQWSADGVRKDIYSLGAKIDVNVKHQRINA